MGSDMTLCAILNLKEHGERQEKLYLTKAAELEIQGDTEKRLQNFLYGTSDNGELVSFVLW